MPFHLIAEEGPELGRIFNLSEGEEWVIGRDPDVSDFVLEDHTVSRKHARLAKRGGQVFLKNLSRVNPTLINQEEQKQEVLLKEGDRVQIGNSTFLFSEEEIPQEGEEVEEEEEEEEVPSPEKKGGYDDIFSDLEEKPPEEEAEAPKEEEEEEPEPALEEKSIYDTIFEDSEEEEEAPFDLMASDTPFLLKVISGPNAGAEFGLQKGRSYTLGKDPAVCDLVFQDLSVSRTHAKLSINDEGSLDIEDLQSKNGTVVNGSLISETQAISSQDVISLGTTTFLIIDRDAPQETIYSPALSSREEEPEEELKEEEPEEPQKDWKQEKVPGKYLVLGGAFLAVFFIAFLSFFSLFKPKAMEIAHKAPKEAIEEALHDFHAVNFSFNPASGKLFITGHVLLASDYAQMRYLLEQIPTLEDIEDNVVVDEYVWKSMNDILSPHTEWQSVHVGSSKSGHFIVKGYVDTLEEANTLQDFLNVNFPYVDRLENRVVVEEVLKEELKAAVLQSDFVSLQIEILGGDVTISGRYPEKKKKELARLISHLEKMRGVFRVKDLSVASTEDMAAIDVSSQFQVGGSSLFEGRGFSVILNGKIYTLGDRVEGMRITKIAPGTILLEKDGLKYKIDYTGRG